ncbi:hypothetical protein ABEG17_08465 [Pedococcus sp. KACC 23699]|uniref:Uncharacterized protein n=1 Tax=Pedococcus sp. KACC 23699 TaxID=3149228 RepID=A0AAU7JZ37_9MICO
MSFGALLFLRALSLLVAGPTLVWLIPGALACAVFTAKYGRLTPQSVGAVLGTAVGVHVVAWFAVYPVILSSYGWSPWSLSWSPLTPLNVVGSAAVGLALALALHPQLRADLHAFLHPQAPQLDSGSALLVGLVAVLGAGAVLVGLLTWSPFVRIQSYADVAAQQNYDDCVSVVQNQFGDTLSDEMFNSAVGACLRIGN